MEEKEPTCNELGCFADNYTNEEKARQFIFQKNGSYSIHFVGRTRIGGGPLVGELARPLTLDRLTTRIRAAWGVIRGRSVAVRWYL